MGVVLVGLDGSEASRDAFRAAVEEAALRGWAVRVAHVYTYAVTPMYQAAMGPEDEYREEAQQWLEQELKVLVDEHDDGLGVEVEAVVVSGHPGNKLSELALEADLMVMGSRGRSGVRSVLLGSVSTFCLHHLACPLLIVPAPIEPRR